MGRIKTKLVKRTVKNLLVLYKDNFSDDFDKNKKAVGEVAEIPSKKLRNIVAGYLTRLVKQRKAE